MDVLLVLGAWAAGSVLAGLGVGAVIAGADRSAETGRAPGTEESRAVRSRGAAADPLRLAGAS